MGGSRPGHPRRATVSAATLYTWSTPSLRFGTALGQAGVGAAVIQRLLGHVDLSTTQGYVHVDVEPGHVDVFGER